jgi:hypothetical protein
MKKTIFSLFLILTIFCSGFSSTAYAQTSPTPTPTPATVPVTMGTQQLPSEGAWIIDPEVTTVGKNASRSGMLLDWTLKDYKWSSDTSYTNNPLTPFWLIIQRIVYSLFLFVILVTAFLLIITRGKSLSAKRFLPRFLLVVLLVTFSFSLVQFLYQIIDIFQGFFLKNPKGDIISSRDLLFIGFDYRTFQGLRVFGESYNESAFISLLLVKLTSFTYYVMAILLIFRKIILWFLIIISPVFPILLLFYPLRNTAKIWIGEFFRWLLYAPLFAILLSGLVRLWNSGLPLFFSSAGVGNESSSIYPTSVNILLGGPGQHIGINNSVNLPDTFALYLVALLMLWAVIILPFILLQIFLDYMMAFNNRDNPFMKQIFTMLNNRPNNPAVPPTPPVGAGLARNLPFARRFSIPKTTGLAREIPRGTSQAISRPITIQRSNQTEIAKLTNLSIPTMRDIARFETTKLSHDVRTQQEIERTRQNLINIANPASVSSVTERERVKMIHDRLVTEGQKGSQVATNILNAANTFNSYSFSTQSSVLQVTQQLIENLSHPTTIISKRDQQKIIEIRQELIKASDIGNQFAKTVLSTVNNYTNNQVQSLQKFLNQLASPERITDVKEKETFTKLREKITSASKSGNPLANLLSQTLENTTSTEQVKKIQEELLVAQAQGNPLATELLKTASITDKSSEKDMEKLYATLKEESAQGNPLATLLLRTLSSQEKSQASSLSATAKLKSGILPQVNRIQQVSLDDYEAVKKMWTDNYRNLEVPNSQQSRKQWIDQDISSIQETISLLSSADPQDVEKGMQQVSDILPFLLIGGFSQTEIIAYLKAKMEAGKDVLENTSQKEEEEDTLISAERAAKQASGHLTASIAINGDEAKNSVTPSPAYQEKVVIQPQESSSSQVQSNNYSQPGKVQLDSPSTIVSQLKLPLPTLRDIASFETNNDGKTVQDLKKLFIELSRPETVTSPTEQKNLLKIKQTLQEQAQKGDSTAQMIVSALGLSQTTGAIGEKHDFLMILKTILDPSLAPEDDQTYYRQVRDELVKARQNSDIVAIQVMKLVDKISQSETESIVKLLQNINNPEQINNEKERTALTALKKDLESQKVTSQTASNMLTAAQNNITPVSANKIRVQLLEKASQSDPLATSIMKEYIILPQPLIQEINNLYSAVQKSSSDPFSKLLLKLLSQPAKKSTTGLKIERFPRENRIQKVSLDDYEEVKQMLYEMYLHGIVPPDKTGKEQSRIDWITEEKQQVEEVVNLLSSDDMSNVQLGMTKVNQILPFLLLGGFSQNEVLQYLKAKQEAAILAIQSLKAVEEKVFTEKKEDTINPQKRAIENEEPIKDE